MKKTLAKVTGLRLQVTVLTAILALAITYNLPPTTSTHAQQSPLTTLFSPITGDLKTNEEKIIKLTLTSDTQIAALDLKFQTSGGLTITDFRDALETDTNLNAFESKQISETLNTPNPEASYILTVPNSKLPKTVTLYMKIKGSVSGEGKITLDYNKSQVLNASGALLQINPNQSVTYNLNLTQSTPNFISASSLPPVNYPATTAKINLKLKLYGALANNAKLKATSVAVGRNGESEYETDVRGFDLTQNPDGTFSGTVAFPDFQDGTKFSLMLKVDKYLLKRICDPNPKESKPDEYKCADPSLTIRRGENNFNFSGVSLLPGDLGLIDGLLNGYDLSIVKNNMGKTTPESIGAADLNYDGIVNEKDFEIITTVAGNTNRQADQ